MAFAFMKELLVEAKRNHYAIGQFNINGLQWTKAILLAAEEERSPVIAAASERMIDYLGGYRTVVSFVDSLVNELNITFPLFCILIMVEVFNHVLKPLTLDLVPS